MTWNDFITKIETLLDGERIKKEINSKERNWRE